MPRLQILHHKSYHPYNEKNKQRVREDEAKAQAEEEERERQRIDKDSSARLDALRRRAGSPSLAEEDVEDLPSTSSIKQDGVGTGLMERHRKAKLRAEKEEKKRKDRLDFDFPSETARKEKKRIEKYGKDPMEGIGEDDKEGGREIKWESGGHLNLFADLEERDANGGSGPLGGPSMGDMAKKVNAPAAKPDPFTLYLGRPDKETKPWYTDRELKRVDEKETGEEAEKRRARDKRKDERSKSRYDPMTQVNDMLAKHPSTKRSSHHTPAQPTPRGLSDARATRESGERQRALALIAQRKRGGMAQSWDDTPSSAAGWAERNEREKDRAGHRFFGGGEPPRRFGRSWDI